MEKPEKTYSLHRYLDGNGAPDKDKIFSEIESPLRRHLDTGLKNIWWNQPEDVKSIVDKHLRECPKCYEKFKKEASEDGQMELPVSL